MNSGLFASSPIRGCPMRTTFSLDDDLVAEARDLTGIQGMSAVVHEALKALIARARARRLALSGGSQPYFKVPPRRRPDPA
jgi:Arc/MetJ family transcription regulator